MSGLEGGQQPGDPAESLRPQTASVLAALASRGVDLPGVSRPTGDVSASNAPRYTVLDQVARGGMGVVLRVRDEDLRRELAMKVLDRADRKPEATASDPRDLGRFLEEAQVTGQLDHPGVPPIHELGLDQDGRLFFTMKLVRGDTFADVIASVRDKVEGWTTTRALGVVLKVCEAMAYAHHKGVIHRDIKPANIMVGRFGETYVMDWGLAKVLDGAGEGGARPDQASLVTRSLVHTDRREAAGDDGSSHATLHGDVVGTPAYMAPEQARGDLDALGPHSDIYAVGALLYHLLTGQPPYIEPGVRVSPQMVLRWVIESSPRPLAELAPEAPAELVAVVEKAMAREPGLRYVSMLDLAADLQAFIEDRVVRAYQSGAWAEARKWVKRNKPLAAAAGLLLLVALGSLATISWVQADARATVEERNALLGQSNAQLEESNTRLADAVASVERSNAQLGQANAALEDSNAELAATNDALDAERAAAESARDEAERERAAAVAARATAEQAREQAVANADLAAANERRALDESYAANMTAAAAALDDGAGKAARRHLAACPEGLRGWDWQHLSLRADPSLAVWTGAESLLWYVEHSPDGRLLATASGPVGDFGAQVREARVIDATSGKTLQVLPSEVTVTRVAFSPDGRLLAWADVQYVRLWDLERGRALAPRHWIGDVCVDLEFVDDTRLLVLSRNFGNPFSRLELWNTSRLDVEFTLDTDPRSGAALFAARPSPDGTRVLVGRRDFSLELRELPTSEVVWRLPGRDAEGGISGLAFDASGRRIVVTDQDHLVRLLDARDGRELARHVVREGVPRSPRFHPDGPWVVLADSSGSVRFLDAETLVEIERLTGHDRGHTSVSISPDGNQLVSAGNDGSLRVWDGRPGAASLRLVNRAVTDDIGQADGNRTIVFSPDGRLVAWTASPRAALLADALTGEVLYRLNEANSAVAGMAFTPDGERLLVETEVALLTFGVADGRLLSRVPSGRFAPWATFDPTCSLLAKVESRNSKVIDVRLVEDGTLAAALGGHKDFVSAGRFTADSQRFVSCSYDGSIRVWDLRTSQVERLIQTDDMLYRIALFDDDRKAVTTTLDPKRAGLSVWDLQTGELIRFLPARSGMLRGDLHPDGACWAGTTNELTVGIWDLERGEMFGLPGGGYDAKLTRFDPTGARLAAVDEDGDLHLFDTLHPRDRGVVRRDASRLARRAGEARALVDALLDEHLLMQPVLDALAADATLDDDLREAAVRDARVRGDDGPWVAERLWARLLPEGVADDQLAMSPEVVAAAQAWLPTAEALHDLWPEYEDAWEPMLWAYVVLGRSDEAAPLCSQAIAAGYSFEPDGPEAIRVLQALATADLGDVGQARVQFAAARESYERGLREAPGELSDLAVTARLIALAKARLGGG